MVKRMGGFRRKTRSKMKKHLREKGKIDMRAFFHEYSVGDRVYLKADPAVHKGMYFPRFHGKSGVVTGKQGRCYKIKFKDHAKEKMALVHPVHLKSC